MLWVIVGGGALAAFFLIWPITKGYAMQAERRRRDREELEASLREHAEGSE